MAGDLTETPIGIDTLACVHSHECLTHTHQKCIARGHEWTYLSHTAKGTSYGAHQSTS